MKSKSTTPARSSNPATKALRTLKQSRAAGIVAGVVGAVVATAVGAAIVKKVRASSGKKKSAAAAKLPAARSRKTSRSGGKSKPSKRPAAAKTSA